MLRDLIKPWDNRSGFTDWAELHFKTQIRDSRRSEKEKSDMIDKKGFIKQSIALYTGPDSLFTEFPELYCLVKQV